MLCGSRVLECPGFIPLSDIADLSVDETGEFRVMLKRWNDCGRYLRQSSHFDFVPKRTYLLPFIEVDEPMWNVMRLSLSAPLTGLFSFVFEQLSDLPDFDPMMVMKQITINNTEMSRFLLVQCTSKPTMATLSRVCDFRDWLMLCHIPSLGLFRSCPFCLEIVEDMVSNLVEPICGHWTTSYDLSPPVNGRRMVPDKPSFFRHPTAYHLTVWNACPGVSHIAQDHTMEYPDKVEMWSMVKAERKEDFVYFHYTEQDIVLDDTHVIRNGWHGHINVTSTHLIEMSCGQSVFQIRWCDYVLLCSTFNWVMKVIKVSGGSTESFTKMVELPFPLHNSIEFMRAHLPFRHLNFGCYCISLQLRILETGTLPYKFGKLGHLKPHVLKERLWVLMFREISEYEPDTDPIIRNRTNGDIKFHKVWFGDDDVPLYDGWKIKGRKH